MKQVLNKTEEKMKKSIEALNHEFKSIRAGRANAAVLDKIHVDYYGVPTKIDQMAAISVPEARMLVIQPWDVSVINQIEKAIQASELGLNPNNDGKVIRIAFPPLTEERRRTLVKEVSKFGEEGKVAIRSIRRDANEKLKAMKKSSEITEDDLKVGEEQIQKLTDKYCKEVDDLIKIKEKEIMEI
ncbi:ribosome recycling factor [Paludicola sp. MB14-C6]|uniref:ribosome recycling factor n=1 Tax=Paludihabitans sp. MB14-C6 TaxID=3070656 RepID=UPI0027DC0207|nr:ribosome recycling factor [Paludicola sp. MB14-C6]WMJ23644.1 ribosome recycling factor [Paludicola sp. MB14-C6]